MACAAAATPGARPVTAPVSASNISSSRANALSAARAMLDSSSPSSTVVKRTAVAMVWRWMNGPAAPAGTLSACLAGTSIK